MLGQAQTGTGKTAAFALPILSNLDLKQKAPQVLVLAPTRELAIQVAEAFKSYGLKNVRLQATNCRKWEPKENSLVVNAGGKRFEGPRRPFKSIHPVIAPVSGEILAR